MPMKNETPQLAAAAVLPLKKTISNPNQFKDFEIRLETKQRADVVLKTILRQIRRHYIKLFNESTNYIKSKRGKGSDFFKD